MRKFGLLCLAIVLALGALGVGYATWTDTITIQGTVTTGSVCLGIEDWAEVNYCPASQYATYPDRTWSGWVFTQGSPSCPKNYVFDEFICTDKDVAWLEFTPMQADGTIIAPGDIGTIPVEKLGVVIKNAYPHFQASMTFHVCNCGNIPIILKPVVITQDDFIVIEYVNGGDQLEPGLCHEISLYIGVTQHQGHWAGDPERWIVDDDTWPMLPQGTTIDPAFTLTVEAEQWEECP